MTIICPCCRQTIDTYDQLCTRCIDARCAPARGLDHTVGCQREDIFTFEIDQCDQCVAAMINGVFCHEHGCPMTP